VSSEGLTELYGEVISNIEKEALDRFDVVDARETCKYVGRAATPEFVMRPVSPPRGFNTGGLRSLSYHLKGIALALGNLVQSMAKALDPGEWAGGNYGPWLRQRSAGQRLVERLRAARAAAAKGLVAGSVDALTEVVESCNEVPRLASELCTAQQIAVIRSLKEKAEGKAKQASTDENEDHFRSIKEFYRKASEGSAGVLHKLVKAKPMPKEEVPVANGTLFDPLVACEEQRNSWGSIWLEGNPVQGSMRPWLEYEGTDDGERLTPITAEEVRSGGLSFKCALASASTA
jgi:hypothetical protein